MSIKLPKYSIQESNDQPTLLTKVLPFIMLFLGLVVGYVGHKFFNDNNIDNVLERNKVLEEIKEQDQQKINDLSTQVSQLETEQQVKNEAILQLQKDYKAQVDIQNDLESEVNFYQQLLSPSSENKGLRVFNSKIVELESSGHRLDFTLVQKIQKAKIISGRYEVQISGAINEKQETISIHNKDDSKYEFKYFQKVSLNFSLPKGFKAEQLVVKLFPQNKKSKPVEHTVSWAQHLE